MHVPVLLHEVIRLLDPKEGEFFIDGTIDGGGHAAEILKRIWPKGKLLGVDWDEAMIANANLKTEKPKNSKLILVRGNYADLPEILKKIRKADPSIPLRASGLLLDLGFSSGQLDGSTRSTSSGQAISSQGGKGFSFQNDEPLSMTYDASRKPVSELLRELSEKDLADVIFEFGGERFSRRIAKAIKNREMKKPIRTTIELADTIRRAVPKSYERGRIDPATRTFQALRIYANDELKNIDTVLQRLSEILKSGGRVAVISFHSLEDRIVKQRFRAMKQKGLLNILTPKPIRPTAEEIKENPRSRSAMLRVAVMC